MPARPCEEEILSVTVGERRHGPRDLGGDPQPLAAGGEQPEGRTRAREPRERIRRLGEEVLGVVEEHERPLPEHPLRHRLGQRLPGLVAYLERPGDGRKEQSGITERREGDPNQPVRVVIRGRCSGLEGEPRLTGAAGTGEGEQAGVGMREAFDDLGQFVLAAEERGARDRQAWTVERPEWWVISAPELIEALGRREAVEAVLAEVLEEMVGVEQPRCLAREDDLAAVRRAHDPSASVHVDSDVPRRVERRFAGVDPDPDPDRAPVEALHRLPDGADGGGRGGKGIGEGVALVIHLVAAVARARLPHDPTVLRQRVAVRIDT